MYKNVNSMPSDCRTRRYTNKMSGLFQPVYLCLSVYVCICLHKDDCYSDNHKQVEITQTLFTVYVPSAVPSAVENKTEMSRETVPVVTMTPRLATPADSSTVYAACRNSMTTGPTGGSVGTTSEYVGGGDNMAK